MLKCYLYDLRRIGRASFTDYSKATRVRKLYTAYKGVVETNYISREVNNLPMGPLLSVLVISLIRLVINYIANEMISPYVCNILFVATIHT